MVFQPSQPANQKLKPLRLNQPTDGATYGSGNVYPEPFFKPLSVGFDCSNLCSDPVVYIVDFSGGYACFFQFSFDLPGNSDKRGGSDGAFELKKLIAPAFE